MPVQFIYDSPTFAFTNQTDTARVRWVYDEGYDPETGWGLDEPEQSKAVAEERAKLETGALVALGAIVETKCPACGAWERGDSLWGIVTPGGEELNTLAEELGLEIPN